MFTLDPFINIDENGDRPTWPPVGTGLLIVEDKCEALFISATWTVTAHVGEELIAKSETTDHAHSDAFIARWARQAIRTNYVRLRQLGVDAEGYYLKYGGKLEDLKR